MARRALVAVAGITAVVSLTGCGSTHSAGSPDTPGVLAGVCRAHAAADPVAAEEHFAGVHRRLHRLAGEVEQRNRSAAADLLEAKQAVEATLAEQAGARAGLREELRRLVDAVRDGLQAVDRPAPPCDADDAESG